MTAPQIIMIVIYALNLFSSLLNHGKEKGKSNFWLSAVATIVSVSILKWGGFF